MTTDDKQFFRFMVFVFGQILLTLGGLSLLFSYTAFPASLAMIIVGSLFLGAGGPSMTSGMRAEFPFRLRISLFFLSLTILAATFAMHSK